MRAEERRQQQVGRGLSRATLAGMKETREQLAASLRDRGLRVTPQRRAVWAAFDAAAGEHLGADDVLRRARRELPEISRGTVYNALTDFVEVGLLRTAPGRSSLLFEPNAEPHDHFQCRVCRRLFDVKTAGLDGVRLATPGFEVEREQVLFEGACPSCANAA